MPVTAGPDMPSAVSSVLAAQPAMVQPWAIAVPDAPLLDGDRSRFGLRLPVHGWRGESGAWLAHTVFPVVRALTTHGPGNYILARRRADGRFDPLYIGETEDLPSRLASHEKWEAALALGMTHVHVHHLAVDRGERLEIEADLRRRFRTPLNESAGDLAALPVPPATS